MTSPAKQVHALCGYAFCGHALSDEVRYGTPFGELTCRDWDDDPFSEQGFRGLPWGVGDAIVAGLHGDDWRVVRIEDEEGLVPIPATPGASQPIAAVKFRRCTVLYRGSPRGALETIVRLGADPDRMAAELAVQNELGVADAGDHGVAIAARGGCARAGLHGHAFVETTWGGYLSVAIAGQGGGAHLEGDDGLAIADSHGRAVGGTNGIVIARGVGARASSGDGGLAVAMGPARSLSTGNGATALALRRVGSIEVGADALGIAMNAIEGRTQIRGHNGARFILRLRGKDGDDPHFAIGLVGHGQLKPRTIYVWSDGAFREAADMGRLPHEDFIEPDSEWPLAGEPQDETVPPLDNTEPQAGRPFGDETIVLCPHRQEWPRVGPIHAQIRGPNSRPSPIVGLAWGEGGPHDIECPPDRTSWALVRVAAPVPLLAWSTIKTGAVFFEAGEIIESGSLREVVATLRQFGGGRQRIGRVVPAMNGVIVHADAIGVATAPDSGWAFAGSHGEADAGNNGFARVGSCGTAHCGVGGIAIADEGGNAEAEDYGIAVSEGKRYGNVTVGCGGVAIGLERYKIASAGHHGAAIAWHGIAGAGREAIAIGSTVFAGRGSVAIGTDRLSGEMGALLVAYPSFHCAVVGQEGIEPATQYVLREGKFCPADPLEQKDP